MVKQKTLIMITNFFPFDSGEAFIENESSYFNEFNNGIIAATSLSTNPKITRLFPDSKFKAVNITPKNNLKIYSLLWTLRAFFTCAFWYEIGNLIKKRKFSFIRIIQALGFIRNGERRLYLLRKEIANEDFNNDVVIYSYWFHIHSYISIRLRNSLKRKNIKVICRAHRYDLYEYMLNTDYIPLREWIFEQIDGVYTISMDGFNYLNGRYPQYKHKVKLNYLGTKDYGIELINDRKKELHLLSCSRVTDVKRVNLIIEALSDIRDLTIRWTHIGDGPLLENIKSEAKTKLPSNIKYTFLGNLQNGDVINFYIENEVHVFINVSSSEGLPVSIMEATSFGIPVIATDVGGTKEIIHSGQNGFLLSKDFKLETLSELIVNITKMSNNEYLYLRENARELWMKYFNAETNYEDFYKHL